MLASLPTCYQPRSLNCVSFPASCSECGRRALSLEIVLRRSTRIAAARSTRIEAADSTSIKPSTISAATAAARHQNRSAEPPADDAAIASPLRRSLARLLPLGALTFSASMLVSFTVPANAIVVPASPAPAAAVASSLPAQSLDVADVDSVEAERGKYNIIAPPPPKPKPKPAPAQKPEPAPQSDPVSPSNSAPAAVAPAARTGAVRWPFPTRVPISDGFGPRVSPCAGCSSQHMGTDFLGGDGNPIYAIADGVVSLSAASGGYGTHVYIDHVVNGQQVRSLYSHMRAGSTPLFAGQRVSAGDFVGLVGSTGNVTGPHLHFELTVNGTNVDPYAWLQANAG